MAKAANEKIAEAAVRLFNDRGYEGVSLRDIAKEAGVAIGTLTYHFTRKEDLLDALLADLHTEYEASFDRTLQGEGLLANVVALFQESAQNQRRYPFYFEDISGIVRCSSSLSEEARAFEESLIEYYTWALASLSDQGILRNDLPPSFSWRDLAATMVVLQASWNAYGCPASMGVLPETAITDALCSLLVGCASPSKVALVARCCKGGLSC